jgi:site-specific DNA-methyltransferase (adenine-specific)
VFGISLFVPCVITYINKTKKPQGIECDDKINKVYTLYESIESVNKFSDIKIYPQLKRKIQTLTTDNLLKHINSDGKYFINVPQIRGDVKDRDKKDIGMDSKMLADTFYSILSKKVEIENNPKQQSFSFNTEEEASNFLNYLKTNFARFCISIYKNNQNQHRGELEIVPWLDFSQEWTDEKLIEHFQLIPEEVDFINKVIPKYY